MKVLGLTLLATGLCLLAYALSVPAYTDSAAFFARYMQLSPGQSSEYWALRDSMLTPRFKLEDYAFTCLTFGAILIFASARALRSTQSKGLLVSIALLAPILTAAGYIGDLFLGFSRNEFPHWADSLGIPLMATPALILTLFAWAAAHLLYLKRSYIVGAPLSGALSFRANPWLVFVSSITLLLVGAAAAAGQFYYAIPGTLWLYFYMSLAAGRRSSLASNNSFKPKPLRGSA